MAKRAAARKQVRKKTAGIRKKTASTTRRRSPAKAPRAARRRRRHRRHFDRTVEGRCAPQSRPRPARRRTCRRSAREADDLPGRLPLVGRHEAGRRHRPVHACARRLPRPRPLPRRICRRVQGRVQGAADRRHRSWSRRLGRRARSPPCSSSSTSRETRSSGSACRALTATSDRTFVASDSALIPRDHRGIGCAGDRSAVVGSMTALTSDTRVAGNPPWRACSRISSSLARYRRNKSGRR